MRLSSKKGTAKLVYAVSLLIKTFKDLKQLEMELDKLNFNYFLGTLSFEVVLRI